MKKKFIALTMTAAMGAGLLAGCGSTTSESQSGAQASGSETAETASEELVTVKMAMIGGAGSTDDTDAILEQVNAVLEEECNANLEIEWIDIGGYSDQVNLEISSGDGCDIYPAFANQVSSLYAQDAMMDVTDLVNEYGQGIIDAIGEDYMQAGYKGGALVAIPTAGTMAMQTIFLYRTDIAEKYGIDMTQVSSLEDLTSVFETVCSQEEGMVGMVSRNPDDSMLYRISWDSLGDEYGVLMNPTEDTEVVDLFETEEYANYVNLMHEWYENGYIQTDAATSQDNVATLLGAGNAFGTLYAGEAESQIEASASCGYELGTVEIANPLATTDSAAGQILFINSMSENAQKAVEVLNVLYSSYDVQTLLEYGIEGTNYVLDDEGRGTFAEGADMNSCGYHPMFGAFFGNALNCLTWDSHTAEYHEAVNEFNGSADVSLALGFSYDSSAVANQLAAIASVTSKYRRGLECGSLDPSELDTFISELKTAGIDDVIAEKQAQLDEWLAAKK